MNYIISGTSYKLIDAEIEKIIKNEKVNTFDLEDNTLEEVLEDVLYQSMFNDKKNIIIKNFLKSLKKENKDFKTLLNYLKETNENTTIIFIANEKISSRGAIKELLPYLKVIETPIITKSYELAKLLESIFKRDDFKISTNALNIFAEKCNSNYDIAINEYDKLKTFKRSDKVITEQDIQKYVCNYNLTDVFGFKDAVINKDIEKAMKMIDELEYSKMELVPTVVMLAKEFITLYDIKLLAEQKKSNDEISLALNRMHPFRVKLLRGVSAKYQIPELEKNILYLCNLDKKLISEDNLGFDELRKFLLTL